MTKGDGIGCRRSGGVGPAPPAAPRLTSPPAPRTWPQVAPMLVLLLNVMRAVLLVARRGCGGIDDGGGHGDGRGRRGDGGRRHAQQHV